MKGAGRLALPVAVAGLLLIGLAQGIPNRHRMEDDLARRSTAALEAAGLTGVTVSFVGRDGSLVVPRKSDVEKAQAVVAGLDGVRVVSATAFAGPALLTVTGREITSDTPVPDAVMEVARALGNTRFATVELRDGRITLTGKVSGPARDAALFAASQLVGPSNVVDLLDVLAPPPPRMPPEVMQRELAKLPPITFEDNSSTLTAADQAVLAKAAELLRANPFVRVRIEGHTDSNGTAASNLVLSEARAHVVLNSLVGLGITAGRLSATGYGETRPKVAEASAQDRAINRRVEFVVIP
jgi:outer membrane protein OmpA-like peptidoglycan-associated protein